MPYLEAIGAAAADNAEQISTDLMQARQARQRCEQQLNGLTAQVAVLEWLVTLAQGEPLAAATTPMTFHAAMTEVLRTAPGRMMRAAELAAEINRRGLYRMRDGRPVEAQQIHARVGHYPDRFRREATYIKLT